jgi:hypothetical protein
MLGSGRLFCHRKLFYVLQTVVLLVSLFLVKRRHYGIKKVQQYGSSVQQTVELDPARGLVMHEGTCFSLLVWHLSPFLVI